jgi:hypothetical protein
MMIFLEKSSDALGFFKVQKFGLRLSLPPHTRMYSEEPSMRRLKCTEVKTKQRRQAPPSMYYPLLPSSMV